ncbi:MAG: diguanylate cyclase [Nitriliruptoraceae bacterium]
MSISPSNIQLPDALASAALDAVENMLVITDRDGVILYVNPAFSEVTGYELDEAVGQTPRLLRSGIQEESFYTELWAEILAGRTWTGELVNRRHDGELYTDQMTITPLLDQAGEITNFIAVKRDVSSHLAALTAGNPSGVAHIDRSGRLVYANDRLTDLLGRSFDQLLGHGWLDTLGPMARIVLEGLDDIAADADAIYHVEIETGLVLRMQYAPLAVGGNQSAGLVVTFVDVTKEQQALHALAQREVQLRSMLEALATPTAVIDRFGVIVQVNRAWRDSSVKADANPALIGVGANYRTVCTTSANQGCEDAQAVLTALNAVLAGASELETLDYELEGPTPTWWELRASPLGGEQGGAIITHTDVTWRYQAQEKLYVKAHTDQLTGLVNRAGLYVYVQAALARARRAGTPITVMFLDVNGFKPINDTYGHEAGDRLLALLATRLRQVTRETDCVARVGGDEFVVVCETLGPKETEALIGRIQRTLAQPADIGPVVSVEVSVGAVTLDGDGDFDQALADADRRMYQAKRARIADQP